MRSWRPKDWDKMKQSILEEPNGMNKFCCSRCGREIIEETADAIIEVLKKNPVPWDIANAINKMTPKETDWHRPNGTVVFIPDEET